jgi:DNA-binding XRE family transcriptional regulator
VFNDFRTARILLGLRQVDVANATGINVQRLSLAERELVKLNGAEELSLGNFLRERLASVVGNGYPSAKALPEASSTVAGQVSR